MSIISRITTWVQSQVLTSSALNGEFNNIVNLINNLDAGTTTWDIVSTKNATAVPLIADNGAGSNDVVDFKVNGTTQWSIPSTGVLTSNSKKITGLANGSAATDAAAYGQLKVLQYVTATTITGTTTTSSTYQSTNLTLSITPSSASTKVLVLAFGAINNTSPANTIASVALFNGSTNLMAAIGEQVLEGGFSASAAQVPMSLGWVDSPGSASAQTYTVKIKSSSNANNVALAVNSTTCFIIAMELA